MFPSGGLAMNRRMDEGRTKNDFLSESKPTL